MLSCLAHMGLSLVEVSKVVNDITRAISNEHQNYDVQIVYPTNDNESAQYRKDVFKDIRENWPVFFFNDDFVQAIIDVKPKCTINVILLSMRMLKSFIKLVRSLTFKCFAYYVHWHCHRNMDTTSLFAIFYFTSMKFCQNLQLF